MVCPLREKLGNSPRAGADVEQPTKRLCCKSVAKRSLHFTRGSEHRAQPVPLIGMARKVIRSALLACGPDRRKVTAVFRTACGKSLILCFGGIEQTGDRGVEAE